MATRTKVIFDQADDVTADDMARALEAVAHKMRARGKADVSGPVDDGRGNIIAEVRVVNA